MSQDIQSAYVDNYLAHYGVVGMKWGKRGRSSGESSSSKKQKVTRSDIVTARKNVSVLADKGNAAIAARDRTTSKKGFAKANAVVEKHAAEYSANLSVAQRKTGMEKATVVLAASAIAVATIGTIRR